MVTWSWCFCSHSSLRLSNSMYVESDKEGLWWKNVGLINIVNSITLSEVVVCECSVTVLCIKWFITSVQISCSVVAIVGIWFCFFFFLCSSLPFLHLQHVGATLGSCGLAWTAWRRPAATSASASTLRILSGEQASSQPVCIIDHVWQSVDSSLCQCLMAGLTKNEYLQAMWLLPVNQHSLI